MSTATITGFTRPAISDQGHGKLLIDGSIPRSRRTEGAFERFSIGRNATTDSHINAAVRVYEPLGDSSLLVAKKKVTILRHNGDDAIGLGSTFINIEQVTLFPSARGLGALPKGMRQNGYLLNPSTVLDVLDGWGPKNITALTEQWFTAVETVPQVTKLTRETLDALPAHISGTQTIAAAFLYTHPGFGSGAVAGCVWFITGNQHEDGILNGYLWVPGNSDLISEHGSIWAADLLRSEASQITNLDDFEYDTCWELPDDTASCYRFITT